MTYFTCLTFCLIINASSVNWNIPELVLLQPINESCCILLTLSNTNECAGNFSFESGIYSESYSIVSTTSKLVGNGKELREYLRNYNIKELIDFGDLQVFDEATTYPLIMLIERSAPDALYQAANVEELHPLDFRQNLSAISFAGNVESLAAESWSLTDRATFQRMQELRGKGVPLGEFVDGKIFYGIKTGYNKAFVVDEATAQRLIDAHASSEKVIKPFYAGRDIKRYKQPKADKYVLYLPWHFPLHEDESIVGVSAKAETELNRMYPAIYQHLLSHKHKLSARNQAETGVRYEWYALQRYGSSYWREFEKPKILYQVFQVEPCFSYDPSGSYCNNAVWMLPNQPRWMVGILNSNLMWEQISHYCTQIRGGYQLISDYFKRVRIVEPSAVDKEVLDRLVGVRMGLDMGSAAGADEIVRVEGSIEGVVGKLYGI